ncbi:hypothetical protein LOK49_LG07G01277 [Camellia lanceoleosa]|uniref:Uncharacterized protein n=1 Tax=Camellia lanceoleosa TaxID=1840588 RepID=A0ACC0GYF4_9ERIC|nr:hypothetical protein LOK49_LG07G01277 [Camellia lanceoleosa]
MSWFMIMTILIVGVIESVEDKKGRHGSQLSEEEDGVASSSSILGFPEVLSAFWYIVNYTDGCMIYVQ